MVLAARILALTDAVAALLPANARGAAGDYCVGVERDGCQPETTLASALAQPDRLRVFVGPGTFTAPVTDGGSAVEITGAGTGETELGAVRLTSPGSHISDVWLHGRL